MQNTPLLDSETSIARYDGIISTISRFSGKAPINELTRRFEKILNVNPWITSTLISKIDDKIQCQYKEDITDVSPWFTIYNISDLLNHNDTIDKLLEVIAKGEKRELLDELYLLPTEQCINTDAKLVKFSVVVDEENNEFIIIFSMNHIIADGASYYKLLNSISFDEDIPCLNFERKQDFTRLGFEKNHIMGSKKRKLHFFNKNINLDLIGEIKTRENSISPDDWISHHDIIASMFFDAVKSDVSIYPVNARPHVGYLNQLDIGNYIKPIVFKAGNSIGPKGIRRALNKFKQNPEDNESCKNIAVHNSLGPKESFIENSDSKAVLTSWVQSYKQLYLGDDCSYRFHIPLKPSYLHGESVGEIDHLAILFCFNSTTWKLVGMTSKPEWLDEHPLFAKI